MGYLVVLNVLEGALFIVHVLSILLPGSVKAVGYTCFFHYMMLSHVPVGVRASSRLEHIDEHAFFRTNLVEVWIPDGVKDLSHMRFSGCKRF